MSPIKTPGPRLAGHPLEPAGGNLEVVEEVPATLTGGGDTEDVSITELPNVTGYDVFLTATHGYAHSYWVWGGLGAALNAVDSVRIYAIDPTYENISAGAKIRLAIVKVPGGNAQRGVASFNRAGAGDQVETVSLSTLGDYTKAFMFPNLTGGHAVTESANIENIQGMKPTAADTGSIYYTGGSAAGNTCKIPWSLWPGKGA